MSLESWQKSKRPNYVTNVDLEYPYSELPYLSQYDLVKIPVDGTLIEHVDYWGEGRITSDGKNSGFPDCYNVNRQFQEVSNGPDRLKKIPNRIPVRDEEECDTRAYIKDNSVKIVTLMGAPIITTSARDINRMINEREGMVVIYSKPADSSEVKMLAEELKNKLLVYCPDYELSDYLKEPTLMDSHVCFLNESLMKDVLFKYVSTGDYDKAVNLSNSLENDEVGFITADIVNKLLQSRECNVFAYANKLWNARHHDLVEKHFPTEVKLITKQAKIKIIGKYYDQALKLDANFVDNDRIVWGDSKDKTSYRVSWKLIPVWDNNKLLFKIMNTEHNMYIKMDVNVDKYGYGDRQAWGSNNSNEQRHLWKLIPVMNTEGLVFLIENHVYNQSLKLDANVDGYGDRLVWGNNGSVEGNPEYFSWLIKAWE